MKKIVIYFLCFLDIYAIAQDKLALKLYVKPVDVYFVSASKQDSSFLYRSYYFKYKVINNTKDTIRFNTIHFNNFTTITIKDELQFYNFGCFNIDIDDKGRNREMDYCFSLAEYIKLSDKMMLSQIKLIPPNDSIDENVKAYCCPQCDTLNDMSFRKDCKIDEKYIKAQLKYNSKQKLYKYPKGAKYWKGILESEIIFF